MNIKIGAVSSIVNRLAVLGFATLRELLSGYGVMELEIFLSEEPPKQHLLVENNSCQGEYVKGE